VVTAADVLLYYFSGAGVTSLQGGGSERNTHCSFLHKITFIYKVT